MNPRIDLTVLLNPIRSCLATRGTPLAIALVGLLAAPILAWAASLVTLTLLSVGQADFHLWMSREALLSFEPENSGCDVPLCGLTERCNEVFAVKDEGEAVGSIKATSNGPRLTTCAPSTRSCR